MAVRQAAWHLILEAVLPNDGCKFLVCWVEIPVEARAGSNVFPSLDTYQFALVSKNNHLSLAFFVLINGLGCMLSGIKSDVYKLFSWVSLALWHPSDDQIFNNRLIKSVG